jgi:hypothetical protein
MAKDGEVALLLQPYNEGAMVIVWGRQLDQVANAVIKADFATVLLHCLMASPVHRRNFVRQTISPL